MSAARVFGAVRDAVGTAVTAASIYRQLAGIAHGVRKQSRGDRWESRAIASDLLVRLEEMREERRRRNGTT